MSQHRVWQHFQNEAPEIFQQADGRIRFLVRQLQRTTRTGDKVLNVGVGNGLFEELAIQLGMDVYSLDPDGESIARLNEDLGMKGQAKVGRLESIPFDEESFSAVIVSEVLEHLSDDALEKALSEIHRVLFRGGLVMGTVPAREKLSEQLTVCPHCDEKFHRWGHLQSFDEGRIGALLSQYFKVEVIAEKFLSPWKHLDWKGKTACLVKNAFLRAGISWPGGSLYFSALKK
jgi:SAM-dependent methyltransferase